MRGQAGTPCASAPHGLVVLEFSTHHLGIEMRHMGCSMSLRLTVSYRFRKVFSYSFVTQASVINHKLCPNLT